MNASARYDRQLRLWGPDGQQRLANASVCCIGGTCCVTELLRNLVLPGLGQFTIVDNSLIQPNDVEVNFLLPPSSIGQLKGQVLVEALQAFNPSYSKGVWLDHEPTDFKQYDLVVVPNDSYCSNTTIKSLIILESSGYTGRLTLDLKYPHVVVGGLEQEGSRVTDYRLANPWKELKEFTDRLIAESQKDPDHTPYFALLIKALEYCDSDIGAGLRRVMAEHISVDNQIQETLRGLNSFREYANNKYLISALVSDECVARELEEMITKCLPFSVPSPQISGASILAMAITVVRAALTFYERHNVLPLCVHTLPDMTSSTATYTELLRIYRTKSCRDFEEVKRIIQEISTDKDEGTHVIPDPLIETMLKNIRNLRVIYPQSLDNCVDDLDSPEDPFCIDLNSSMSAVSRTACNEEHAINSVIGAVGAQEIIKLVTHKFSPIDNCFLFHGGTGTRSWTYRRKCG